MRVRRHAKVNGRHEENAPWWDYPAEEQKDVDAQRRAEPRRAVAYAYRIRAERTLSLRKESGDIGYIALLVGSAHAKVIVIGARKSRAVALRAGAKNADRIVDAFA